MVCSSLRHDGDELLEDRGGVATYVERRSTMGIPFLHPWGNRLGELSYRGVTLDPATQVPPLRLDPNGLPIHGALAACPYWEIVEHADDRVVARLDFEAHDELLAVFPFPHTVEQAVSIENSALSIATKIEPTGEVAVPIAFGWHPYFRLPGVPAEEWEIDFPVSSRLVTDDRMIPTGERVYDAIEPGAVESRTWDTGFDDVADGTAFVMRGGDRELSVRFEAGYPVAIIWRPEGGQFICIEPMTAPTNALCSGDGLRLVAPGDAFTARWSVSVG